ncbi:MAG: hypothetical protein A3G33_00350 [Omnitrophica bacterium RIFCSPLOWO2_12_FULL_44_17]|uniref:DUF4258 domain-containing protein n=1 Tax=Candidatus Danuiimicrobium aquiferis TaxID=1801832 RepID=A0A1G1KV79_9BACT|nr:MAG: hypothetical protein A3G33_00350 [Omnitrophica bacterium RIFCSPLOWO2_12_FULL_44_17]
MCCLADFLAGNRYRVDEQMVRCVLQNPEQSEEVRKGRIVVQSHMTMEAKVCLIHIFVDTDRHPAEVVTAYRTSKTEKYWRNTR